MIIRHKEHIFPQNLWHLWFAWYPVQLKNGDVAFLQNVYRKHPTYPLGRGVMTDYNEWIYQETNQDEHD